MRKHRYQWVPMASEAISAFGYSGTGNRLAFRFTSGSEYEYDGVEEEVIRDFLNSESKGAFFVARIRNSYPFERLS